MVTGAAGFIGSALVRHLVADTHWFVVSVDRLGYCSSLASLAPASTATNHAFVQADIRDRAVMDALFAEHRPAAVLHLAAETHVDRSIDDPAPFVEHNVMGTFALLEAARAYWRTLDQEGQAVFRFVHVSTDEVFGSLDEAMPPFSAATPYQPHSPYSASKAASDHFARAWGHTYGLPVIVTNCTNNYGPYQFPEKLIPLTIINAIEGRPISVYGNGQNIRDWLHVDDHVRGLMAALERGLPGETYLFGAGAELRNIDVVRSVCNQLDALLPGMDGGHGRLIRMVADRPGHDLRYAVDCSSVLERLHWRPRMDFAQGLADTVAWYLEHRDWWEPIRRNRYDGRRLGLSPTP